MKVEIKSDKYGMSLFIEKNGQWTGFSVDCETLVHIRKTIDYYLNEDVTIRPCHICGGVIGGVHEENCSAGR